MRKFIISCIWLELLGKEKRGERVVHIKRSDGTRVRLRRVFYILLRCLGFVL